MSTKTAADEANAMTAKRAASKGRLGRLGRKRASDEDTEHPPFQASLPIVNLLPHSIRDSVKAGKVRRWLILAIALILAVVAGVWFMQSDKIAAADAEVSKAKADSALIKETNQKLGPVKAMYGQITELQEVVTGTMASQPEAAKVLEQLASDAAAVGGPAITFQSVSVTYTGVPADIKELNLCPNPDPFTTEVTVGCLSFTANATNRGQVSELLRRMEANPVFSGPYVTSTSMSPGINPGDPSIVIFTGSAGITPDGLVTPLTDQEIHLLLNPPEESASASPEAGGGS